LIRNCAIVRQNFTEFLKISYFCDWSSKFRNREIFLMPLWTDAVLPLKRIKLNWRLSCRVVPTLLKIISQMCEISAKFCINPTSETNLSKVLKLFFCLILYNFNCCNPVSVSVILKIFPCWTPGSKLESQEPVPEPHRETAPT
jgi:hypothetical protein